jgi:hypothetical protein
MKCFICGSAVEPWAGGGGYGNNPAPVANLALDLLDAATDQLKRFADDAAVRNVIDLIDDMPLRACRWCNENVVIPVRLKSAGQPGLATAYPSIVKQTDQQ